MGLPLSHTSVDVELAVWPKFVVEIQGKPGLVIVIGEAARTLKVVQEVPFEQVTDEVATPATPAPPVE